MHPRLSPAALRTVWVPLVLVGLLVAPTLACQVPCEHELSPASQQGASTDELFAAYEPATCTPDAIQWDNVVRPVVENKCGACHGEMPSFGAPYALLDYAGLLAGEAGARHVDRLARRSAAQTMPPPASAQLSHDELDLLVEWATCGEVHPDHSVGLVADRELYGPIVPENSELPSFELLADDFAVERETLDRYQCFAMDVPLDEPRFIRRMQVVLDEARVLHHIVVAHDPGRVSAGQDAFECDDWPREETPYLWAWAPGGGAFDFEEGGLRLSPGERVVVQIHYNNGAGLEGISDRSGVRFFHGPTEGREWFMQDPGPVGFAIPPGEQAVCGRERIGEAYDMLAGFPHMHEIGAEFHQYIERADGSIEQVINLTGWDFEAQLMYRYDQRVEKGDRLHTWCGFRNAGDEPVYYGLGTEDEMCFNFTYVSPVVEFE